MYVRNVCSNFTGAIETMSWDILVSENLTNDKKYW
jgi:hypothetical protein